MEKSALTALFVLCVLFLFLGCEIMNPESGTENRRPIASAGGALTVSVGEKTILDGSASRDPDGDSLSFLWTIITRPGGSTADLSDTRAVKSEFTPDLAGEYTIGLVVNDERLDSERDTVQVSVNALPVANPGSSRILVLGDTVQLDASGSSDPEGATLSWEWTVVSAPPGSDATLSDPVAEKPTFTPDVPGIYTICLTVNDGSVSIQSEPVYLDVRIAKLAAPAFSVTGGECKGIQEIYVSNPNDSGFIYLTTDGSDPEPEGGPSEGHAPHNPDEPVFVSEDTTLKAIVASEGYMASDVREIVVEPTGNIFELTHVMTMPIHPYDLTDCEIAEDKLFIASVHWDNTVYLDGTAPDSKGKIEVYGISDNENPVLIKDINRGPFGPIDVYGAYLIAGGFRLDAYEISDEMNNTYHQEPIVECSSMTIGNDKVYTLGDTANQIMRSYSLPDFANIMEVVPISAAGNIHILPEGYFAVSNATLEYVDYDWNYTTSKTAFFSSADDAAYFEHRIPGNAMTHLYKNFLFFNYNLGQTEPSQFLDVDVLDISDPLQVENLGIVGRIKHSQLDIEGDYLFAASYDYCRVYYLGDLVDSVDQIYLAAIIVGDYASWSNWHHSTDIVSGDRMYTYIPRHVPGEEAKLTILKAIRKN